MRITRILFDEAEPTDSIARRVVRAFNPGEVLCVRGEFFKVSNLRTLNKTVRENVVGDKYTLVLNVGDPAPVLVVQTKPTPTVVVPEPVPEPPVDEAVSPSEPPPSAVIQTQAPQKESTSESGEYKIVRADAAKVTREGPPKLIPVVGEVWQTKDSRRVNSPPFTVVSVDSEFAYTDKGAKISLKRWRNYRQVDPLNTLSRQSSG
jgi:hypothetical protein